MSYIDWNSDPEWGFFGHRRINRMAVFTLDQEMMPFFRGNLEYLTDHAVDPDKRRYATKHEAVRHYIDIDHWGVYPYPNVPRDWAEALLWKADVLIVDQSSDTVRWTVDTIFRVNRDKSDRFVPVVNTAIDEDPATSRVPSLPRVNVYATDSIRLVRDQDGRSFTLALGDYRTFWYQYLIKQYYEDEWTLDCRVLATLNWPMGEACGKIHFVDHFSEYGVLPYFLWTMKKKLTWAFEAGDGNAILRTAAEFGHYLGDAHVPLHTTENYNGQLTNQLGIHGFWESRIVELFADENYDYFVGKAEYIDNPREYFWDVVLTSNSLVDSVLNTEKRLSETFPQDQQYCYEDRLDNTVRTQCPEYAAAWSAAMKGMVEERFRASINGVGSIWYTCWIDAGQPDLSQLTGSGFNPPAQDSLDRAYRQESIKGRKHD